MQKLIQSSPHKPANQRQQHTQPISSCYTPAHLQQQPIKDIHTSSQRVGEGSVHPIGWTMLTLVCLSAKTDLYQNKFIARRNTNRARCCSTMT